KALEHKAPLARFQAVRALSGIGKDAAEALPALEARLNDKPPIIEVEAARAILRLGKPHTKALAKLDEHLAGDDRLLGTVLDAIHDLGPVARPLFPAVKKITLEAKDFPLQRDGFNALRGLKGESKHVVQVWVKLVKQNDWFLYLAPEDEIRANIK